MSGGESGLRERLLSSLCPSYDCEGSFSIPPTPCPGHRGQADQAAVVVAAWLSEQAEVYRESPVPAERQIRYELLALAGKIEKDEG